jgi:hypothetical protein
MKAVEDMHLDNLRPSFAEIAQDFNERFREEARDHHGSPRIGKRGDQAGAIAQNAGFGTISGAKVRVGDKPSTWCQTLAPGSPLPP